MRNASDMGQASWSMAGYWSFTPQGRRGQSMMEGRHLEPSEITGRPFNPNVLNQTSLRLYDVPVVILVNYRTASAGDNFVAFAEGVDRFTIIGTNTAGAAGFVATFPLPGGGQFRLAVQRQLTHDGREINNIGIQPDIWVEQTVEDLMIGRDTQLAAAVEYLLKKIAQP